LFSDLPNNPILRLDEQMSQVTIFRADRYEGKPLNSPNNVAVKSDGTVWFADPSYGISAAYEGSKAESEIGSCNVYCFDPRDAWSTQKLALPNIAAIWV